MFTSKNSLVSSVLLPLLMASQACSGQQDSAPQPAVAVEPVSAVLDAFQSHQVVALSFGTHTEESHNFRLSLIRDHRFAATVDDIVVYFGNARYQDTLDQFLSGEDVPYGEFRQVWQNTTQPHDGWDRPIYEAFFRAVRTVNTSLSSEEQLRVVLADPPIDWDAIRDFSDLLPLLLSRPRYFGEIVEREVLAANWRALLIGGAGFFVRDTPLGNASVSDMPVQRIERVTGAKVFTIWTTAFEDLADLQPDIRSWPTPSLTYVRGTTLGMTDFGFFSPDGEQGFLQDHFDAVLYLGPASELTTSQLAPELCSDSDYLQLRLPRLRLAAANGGLDWLIQFREYCDSVTRP